MRKRTVLKMCLALFFFALMVRVGAAVVFGVDGALVEDEIDYARTAESVATGGGFWRLASIETWLSDVEFRKVVSFRPPLLPLLLAPFVRAGVDSPAEMRWALLVLASVVPPLAYLGLRRTALGERAAWVGAALALWPPAVYLSLRILAEPLAAALLLGCLAVPPDPGDRLLPNRYSLAAGALAGLAILARPASLIACVLVACTRGGWRRAAWFGLGLAIVVAPWGTRNWLLHGRPLLTTNTGVTLVGANSAAAAAAEWPGKWLPPDVVYAGAEDPPDLWMWGWSDLTEEQSDARFTRDAVRWVLDHPGDAVVLCFHKVVRLFDPDQHSGKADAALKRVVGWATFLPVLLLAAAGLRRALRDPAFRPWLAVLAGTVLTALVFYGDVRMRSPADPTLLALAAYAVLRPGRPSSATPAGAPAPGTT